MTRVFADQMFGVGQTLMLTQEDSHHIQHVLRQNVGTDIILIAPDKSEYLATLVSNDGKVYQALVVKEIVIEREPKLQITIFQGMPKGDKMEQVITRGTEVGAVAFVPVQMERSIAKINPAKIAKKQDRWQKIAMAAARQAARQVVPPVQNPITFKQMMPLLTAYDQVLLLYEKAEKLTLNDIALSEQPSRLALVIGPEGGITDAEAATLAAQGAKWITLGPRIMRTETAGIAALAILLAKSGDMGG